MADVRLLVSHRIRAARNRVVDVKGKLEVRRKHLCLQRVRDTACDRHTLRHTPGPRDLRNDSPSSCIINIVRPVLLTIFQTGA